MMLLKVIEVDLNFKAKVRAEADPIAQYTTVSIVENLTTEGIAQHTERNAKSVVETTTLRLCIKVEMKIIPNMIIANTDPRKKKAKSSMR